MLSISPSKIGTYKLCPFKYKCDINTDLRRKYKKETPPLVFGNLIHGCLNDLYKRTERDERNIQKLRELFEIKFKSNLEKHKRIFRTQENIIQYVENAKEIFKNFVESEYFNKEPLMTEEYPRYLIKEELEISGKFDRVDLEDNNLILIDYKTGKLNEEEDNEFQLNFYELILSKIKPEYEVREKVLYFLRDNKIVKYSGNRDNIRDVEKVILNIAEKINNNNEFAPTPNDKCIYCEYRSICPIMNNEDAQENDDLTNIPF